MVFLVLIFVSLLSFVPAFLSYSSRHYLPNLPWFDTLYLLFIILLSLSSCFISVFVLYFPCGLAREYEQEVVLSVRGCSLRPRNFFLSGGKHQYKVWFVLDALVLFQSRNID